MAGPLTRMAFEFLGMSRRSLTAEMARQLEALIAEERFIFRLAGLGVAWRDRAYLGEVDDIASWDDTLPDLAAVRSAVKTAVYSCQRPEDEPLARPQTAGPTAVQLLPVLTGGKTAGILWAALAPNTVSLEPPPEALRRLGDSVGTLLDCWAILRAGQEQPQPTGVGRMALGESGPLSEISEILGADGVIEWATDRNGDTLHAVSSVGLECPEARIPIACGYVGESLAVEQPLLTNQLDPEKTFDPALARDRSWQSIAIFPLRADDILLGVVMALWRDKRRLAYLDGLIAQAHLSRLAMRRFGAVFTSRVAEIETQRRLDAELLAPALVLQGLFHDVFNIVFSARRSAAMLQREMPDNPYVSAIATDMQLVRSVLEHASALLGKRGPSGPIVDLFMTAREVVEVEAKRTRSWFVRTSLRGQPRSALVRAEPRHVLLIIHNLLSKAVQLARGADAARIDVSVDVAEDGARLFLEVLGIKLTPEQVATLFDPPFSVSDHEDNLGPYLAREAARQLGGDVRAAFRPESGLILTLELPLSTAS